MTHMGAPERLFNDFNRTTPTVVHIPGMLCRRPPGLPASCDIVGVAQPRLLGPSQICSLACRVTCSGVGWFQLLARGHGP